MKRLALIALALSLALAPGAYAAEDTAAMDFALYTKWMPKAYAGAWLAHTCNLRSDEWYETFVKGMWLTTNMARKKYQQEARDKATYDALTQQTVDNIAEESKRPFPTRQDCDRLVNSPTMRALDQTLDTMTGGYR